LTTELHVTFITGIIMINKNYWPCITIWCKSYRRILILFTSVKIAVIL